MFIKACTPKAVNHRLTNLKKSGSMTGKPPAGSDASSSANTTPKGVAKRGRRSKKAVSNDGDLAIGDEGDAGPETPTPAKKRGRGGKKTVANDEESDIGDQHELVFEDMGKSPTLTPAKKRSRKPTVKNAGEDDDEQVVKKIKREELEGEGQDEGYEMAENLGLGLGLGHYAAGEGDLNEV
jgi:hypothetical protein